MHGLQTIRKLNNQAIRSHFSSEHFAVGKPVNIQESDGSVRRATVTQNVEGSIYFTAGGVRFQKSNGLSVGLDIPIKVSSPDADEPSRFPSAEQVLSQH
jgi:hypothetical protein